MSFKEITDDEFPDAFMQGFQAVVGQPSKPTYTTKAKVAAALGWNAGGKAKAKTNSIQVQISINTTLLLKPEYCNAF